MEAFEQLIDFLYEKGFELNSKSPYENHSMTSMEENQNNIYKLNERQQDFNAIMHELNIINGLLNKAKQNSATNQYLNEYFKNHLNKINNKYIDFDKHHPLYGYKPFVDKMMISYIDNEEYEECVRLKETIVHRETYY